MLWSWIDSCQNCQENIRGAAFWPWPTKHFLASFNLIMKAWTATNSQIETKPVSGPRPLLPLSTRPIIICHWSFPFTRESIGMKTNGETLCNGVDESSVCPRPCPSPTPLCLTHPSRIPPSGALYHDAVSFKRGGLVLTSAECGTTYGKTKRRTVQPLAKHRNTLRCQCYELGSSISVAQATVTRG